MTNIQHVQEKHHNFQELFAWISTCGQSNIYQDYYMALELISCMLPTHILIHEVAYVIFGKNNTTKGFRRN